MGPPGVGKGTQARSLQAKLGVPSIATGDLLRQAVQGGTTLGQRARPFVESGRLVPDELVGELIAERLGGKAAGSGFILDGFPRTVDQVTILDGVLARLGIAIDRVMLLVAPEEEIVRRLSGRRLCPKCGALFHLESRPPSAAGICDECSAALVQRPDDAEDVIRERLRIYAVQTVPVAALYRERGLLREVDATGDAAEVRRRLEADLAEP